MLWLYLHFPHLLLDHLQRSRKERSAMVVITESGQHVQQACPRARELGIEPGLRLKTALSLASELATVQADPERERLILTQQARWLYRHAAPITLCPPDGLLVEAGNLQRLYGSVGTLWDRIEQLLAEHQLTASLAVGQTPLAATLCARAGRGCRDHGDDKALLAARLKALPLDQAGFEPRTLTRLLRLGLTTLGDVFALPPKELARRLAPETLMYVQKIQGTRPDPQTAWQPPHHFEQQADFIQDIERAEGLLFPLQRLLGALEDDLRWRQEDTDRLLLLLHHHQPPATPVNIGAAGPEHRADAFLNLIRLRFEQQALTSPVTALTLQVTRFLPRQTATTEDLLGDEPDLQEAWHTLISRLQMKLGSSALHRLAPQADHRPERAWTTQGLGPLRASGSTSTVPHHPARPLWLMPHPQPLQETPRDWLAGPERISAGWWDGQRVHRDYYIAQLASGALAWVFRDVREGWFIHGWFG